MLDIHYLNYELLDASEDVHKPNKTETEFVCTIPYSHPQALEYTKFIKNRTK